MEGFWKAAALALIAVILGLTVGRQEKDISVLLTICACCILGIAALGYLQPVMEFLWVLDRTGSLEKGMLGILLRAMGVGLTGEIVGLICTDAGNASLGKAVQLLSTAVILYLSLPVLQMLLSIVQEILGEL